MRQVPFFALVLLVLASCGRQDRAARSSPPPSPAPGASAAAPAPEPKRDAIARALDAVTPRAFAADLSAIARPRHHRAAPDGLRVAASYVAGELARAGFTVRREAVSHDGATFDNVIGEKKGAADEVVVGCAHYDAVAGTEGADDDASGVAALLAVARAASRGHAARGIRLVAFAFEEEGLVGSAHHVADLDQAARRAIRAVVNVEMIGYVDRRPRSQKYPREIEEVMPRALLPGAADFIGVIGTSDSAFVLDALDDARKYAPALRVVPVGVPRELVPQLPDLRRSDHARFWDAGVPAVMIGDTADFRSPHYHKPSDTVATLDLGFATDVARWIAAGVLLLAGQSQ